MTTNSASVSTSSLTYSDRIGARSRRPFLILIKGEVVTTFKGAAIPGIVVVCGTNYTKEGKWSHTTYRLELAHGVRAISGREGWETGKFVEGLRDAVSGSGQIDRWPDVAKALGVSVPAAMQFLRSWRPKAAEDLDAVDRQLEALEDAVSENAFDTVTVTVSFGGPTNRAMSEGFWVNPKSIPGHGGELRLIDVNKGWGKENIVVFGMSGTVISATHASGYHGGYVSVTVAVVPGSEVAKIEEPQVEALVPSAPTPEPEPIVTAPAAPATSESLANLRGKFGRC